MKRHPLERSVRLHVSEFYADDGQPIKCFTCGGTKIAEHVRGVIDFYMGQGPASEIEYVCDGCGTTVAYWAYGHFDPSYEDSVMQPNA